MCVRVVTVVQARTTSTRLPGKVLRPVLGRPLLALQLERVLAADHVGTVVVATTTEPADDPICDVADEVGVPAVRGSRDDLLDRHLVAARAHDAEAVVKIPSDCPLIDPAVIDLVLGEFLAEPGRWDYVSNLHPATWPDGHDTEVMPMTVLEAAGREADRPFEREHTTPFIWERPERFRCHNVVMPDGRDLSMTHRWTIDYPEDLAFVTAVYEALGHDPAWGVPEVLGLLDDRPDIAALNAGLAGVNWYRHHLDELTTVDAGATRLHPDDGGAS
ncbi:MAG: glycosyltransferase family protein [Acidimicrobiia bacterium]